VVRSRVTKSSSGSEQDSFSTVCGEAAGLAVWDLLKAAAIVLWWAVLFPMFSLPVAGCGALWRVAGWPAATAAAGWCVLCLLAWRLGAPRSWHRWVSGRI